MRPDKIRAGAGKKTTHRPVIRRKGPVRPVCVFFVFEVLDDASNEISFQTNKIRPKHRPEIVKVRGSMRDENRIDRNGKTGPLGPYWVLSGSVTFENASHKVWLQTDEIRTTTNRKSSDGPVTGKIGPGPSGPLPPKTTFFCPEVIQSCP